MDRTTVAIVTGASRGLGLALAQGLIQAGNQVFTYARSATPALTEQAQRVGCELVSMEVDLSDPVAAQQAAHDLAEQIPATATRIRLINNAGTVQPIAQADALSDAQAITSALTLNVTAPMLLTSAVLRAIKGRNTDTRILNISSGAGRRTNTGWGVYCATKAALDLYTRVVDVEAHGVKVVALAPGVVDTTMQATIRGSHSKDFPDVDRFVQLHEQGQLAAPDAVAGRILRYLERDDFGETVLDDIRNYS